MGFPAQASDFPKLNQSSSVISELNVFFVVLFIDAPVSGQGLATAIIYDVGTTVLPKTCTLGKNKYKSATAQVSSRKMIVKVVGDRSIIALYD
ncbi:hypothetical protein [Dendronalium sp. ChiSLP03b]|uniref:hypothetical protein n=1 Tax=Dendronalium sp. ChiSLP03b TaxID=3075381 RepID=UPI002AD28AC0|nr:hypothetical protein [Dendronalium sp. ChiSLP03b]MDZ8209056.1 hypothetical protein [Dendronalium sp. ChiSLP03b]